MSWLAKYGYSDNKTATTSSGSQSSWLNKYSTITPGATAPVSQPTQPTVQPTQPQPNFLQQAGNTIGGVVNNAVKSWQQAPIVGGAVKQIIDTKPNEGLGAGLGRVMQKVPSPNLGTKGKDIFKATETETKIVDFLSNMPSAIVNSWGKSLETLSTPEGKKQLKEGAKNLPNTVKEVKNALTNKEWGKAFQIALDNPAISVALDVSDFIPTTWLAKAGIKGVISPFRKTAQTIVKEGVEEAGFKTVKEVFEPVKAPEVPKAETKPLQPLAEEARGYKSAFQHFSDQMQGAREEVLGGKAVEGKVIGKAGDFIQDPRTKKEFADVLDTPVRVVGQNWVTPEGQPIMQPGRFGIFDRQNGEILLNPNGHPLSAQNTIIHELIHAKQNLKGKTFDYSLPHEARSHEQTAIQGAKYFQDLERKLHDISSPLEGAKTGQPIESGATVKPNGKEVPQTENLKTTQATEGQGTQVQGGKAETTQTPLGQGETKTSTLGLRVEQTAIEKKLTSELADLPQYQQLNMKDQAKKATDLLNSDPERALRVALGQEASPEGLVPESVFKAMEASVTTPEMAQKLATSPLVSTGTALGQRIKALDVKISDSPVEAIRQVIDARAKVIENRTGRKINEVVKKTTEDIKSKVKTPDKYDWGAFLDSIKC